MELMESIQTYKYFYIAQSGLPFSACIYQEPGAPLHWHKYWEILCQVDGKTLIRVGKDEIVSTKGEITVIGPEEIHGTEHLSAEHSILMVQFETSAIVPYLSSLSSLSSLRYLVSAVYDNTSYKKHFCIKEGREAIQQTMNNILDEYSKKKLGYELEIQSQLMHLFSLLICNHYLEISQIPEERAIALEKVRTSIAYIEMNYAYKLTLEEVANVAYMSTYNFCRTFKKATGKTMIEYINFVRLKEAEKLLIASTKNISDISLEVGFSSLNYFNRLFKKKNGISPYQFRKQNSTSF
jgi:AraC-like DNA-binding protein